MKPKGAKPTHIGLLEDQTKVRLYESVSFWSTGKIKFRKTDGTRTGKQEGPKLILDSIEPLPSRIWLVKDDHKYEVVSSDTKKDLMVLRNVDGMTFETHISKVSGYSVVKEFD